MVTVVPSISAVGLFGRTREAVLGLLLVRADERFHLRQIARLCGTGLGAVQRELSALTKAGILRRGMIRGRSLINLELLLYLIIANGGDVTRAHGCDGLHQTFVRRIETFGTR